SVLPDNNNVTDVVEKTWEQRVLSGIDVTPDHDVNQTGRSHTVTAYTMDQFGDPVSGVNVDFIVSGRNSDSQYNVISNADGLATFTYSDAGNVNNPGSD